MFDQFGAVKFEEVWAYFPEEVILGECFNFSCIVIKESLFESFREDGDDVKDS